MDVRNVLIIGSGPAGLTAALYSARASLEPLVFAGVPWGGQLMLTTDVENYPGFPEGILGPELMKKFRDQAERFGAEIIDQNVTAVDFSRLPMPGTGGQAKAPFKVTAEGKVYDARAVIIASGEETNWLGLANEQKLIGRGVSS
ncbi:MAG: FAD-dependent oxidoreductase, partial [Candidatus Curtissbacteria bacterium]